MKPSIWTQSNGGETTTFWSCAICGASVQPQDKETHEDWHGLLGETTKCVHAPKGKR
jgi:hypothetical protein